MEDRSWKREVKNQETGDGSQKGENAYFETSESRLRSKEKIYRNESSCNKIAEPAPIFFSGVLTINQKINFPNYIQKGSI